MEQVNIIGIDLAKRSFQLHGARADGSVAFRRKVATGGRTPANRAWCWRTHGPRCGHYPI